MQTLSEVNIGRMSPLSIISGPGRPSLLTRRFGVAQKSSSGRWKLRCIDDYTTPYVNLATFVDRRLILHSAADLAEASVSLSAGKLLTGLRLLKSDVHSAYQCLPIASSDLDLADVLVHNPKDDNLYVSKQLAMPSEAAGSVYAWDILAEGVRELLCQKFELVLFRYVDDFFGVALELLAHAARETRDPPRGRFSPWVDSLDEKTSQPTLVMPILGVSVALSASQVEVSLSEDKLEF